MGKGCKYKAYARHLWCLNKVLYRASSAVTGASVFAVSSVGPPYSPALYDHQGLLGTYSYTNSRGLYIFNMNICNKPNSAEWIRV